MTPRDAVAIILALIVATALISGSRFGDAFLPVRVDGSQSVHIIDAWKDVLLVIIGILAGYVSRNQE